jgi:hypothetical protein
MLIGLTAGASACAPTVNVSGVYLPPSVVSTLIGLGVGYGIVRLLARSVRLRALAQSALFFLSVAIVAGVAAWWSLYRDF